jgi:hypothetical protein
MKNKARRIACLTCPFNDGNTEAASIVQNYGCLPTKFEILRMKDNENKEWRCHDDLSLICGGLAAEREVGDGIYADEKTWGTI